MFRVQAESDIKDHCPVWIFLKKLGIKLPYDPEIPLLSIYLEEIITEKAQVPQCS